MYCRVSSMILGLSSFPGRLCPAITARGLSDSMVSSAEIHSRRVCAFDSANYLTEAHRNNPGTGCPVSALAGDLGRSDKRTRAVVTRQIREGIELIATRIRARNENDRAAARSHAVLTHCALVGAIGVARAVSDEKLSREILKTVAQLLKNSE